MELRFLCIRRASVELEAVKLGKIPVLCPKFWRQIRLNLSHSWEHRPQLVQLANGQSDAA